MERYLRLFSLLLATASLAAEAQIYHCETPQGPVYSDEKCGDDAEVVSLEEASSGIAAGPSEEVREYLSQQRRERAEERRDRLAPGPTRVPETAVLQPERQVPYPVFPYGPERPPRPEQPPEPPAERSPASVLRLPDED